MSEAPVGDEPKPEDTPSDSKEAEMPAWVKKISDHVGVSEEEVHGERIRSVVNASYAAMGWLVEQVGLEELSKFGFKPDENGSYDGLPNMGFNDFDRSVVPYEVALLKDSTGRYEIGVQSSVVRRMAQEPDDPTLPWLKLDYGVIVNPVVTSEQSFQAAAIEELCHMFSDMGVEGFGELDMEDGQMSEEQKQNIANIAYWDKDHEAVALDWVNKFFEDQVKSGEIDKNPFDFVHAIKDLRKVLKDKRDQPVVTQDNMVTEEKPVEVTHSEVVEKRGIRSIAGKLFKLRRNRG